MDFNLATAASPSVKALVNFDPSSPAHCNWSVENKFAARAWIRLAPSINRLADRVAMSRPVAFCHSSVCSDTVSKILFNVRSDLAASDKDSNMVEKFVSKSPRMASISFISTSDCLSKSSMALSASCRDLAIELA